MVVKKQAPLKFSFSQTGHIADFASVLLSILVAATLIGSSAIALGDDSISQDATAAAEAGMMEYASGDIEGAIAEMERAIVLAPDYADVYFFLGTELYPKVGRFADAIESLEQARHLEPERYGDVQMQIDRFASILSTPEEAIRVFAACQSYEPGSDRAIAACKEAVRIHPPFRDAQYALGVHYIYAGDEESAKKQVDVLASLGDEASTFLLLHRMAEMKPEWLTESYSEKIKKHIPPIPERPTEGPMYEEFSEEELTRISHTYAAQIEVIKDLLTEIPQNVIPEDCETNPAGESLAKLRERLAPLSFAWAHLQKEDCTQRYYYLFREEYGDTRVSRQSNRVGTRLDIAGTTGQDWWVAQGRVRLIDKAPEAECIPILDFKISLDVDGIQYDFSFFVKLSEEVGDKDQCAE